MWRLSGLGELSRINKALVCEFWGFFFFFFSIGVGNTTNAKDTGNHILGYNHGV